MNIINSKTIKYIAIALAATMHYSCIKEVENLNLPNTQPKLVVQSFISPGDSIIATVYASKPINYNITGTHYSTFDTIKTATVTLTNLTNGSSTTIPFDTDKKKYILHPLDFTIEKGIEYELNVTANKFNPITTRTTVPTGLASVTISKIDTTRGSQFESSVIRISGFFNDPANEVNFYQFSSYIINEYFSGEGYEIMYSTYYSTYVTDNNHNGGNVVFKHETHYWENETVNGFNNTNTLILYMYEVDEHYYRFHKSLETISDIMDNPFTESAHLYSNIEGGLGVFASFVRVEQTSTKE